MIDSDPGASHSIEGHWIPSFQNDVAIELRGVWIVQVALGVPKLLDKASD